MTIQKAIGVRRLSAMRFCAAIAALCLLPASAQGLTVTLSGQDLVTNYDYVASGNNNDSTLSFTKDGDSSGLVSNVDNYGGPGLDAQDLTDQKIRIFLNLSLGDDTDNGTGPFVPSATNGTGNINKAQFVGSANGTDPLTGWDIMIFSVDDAGSPNSPNALPLLTFEVTHLDVTTTTTAFGLDNGSITLGDPNLTATSSLLTLTGGTLADDFGGIGEQARFALLLFDLNPALTNNRGYFGQDVENGASGTSATWELVIAAPEPNTALLVGGSLALVGWARRRRTR